MNENAIDFCNRKLNTFYRSNNNGSLLRFLFFFFLKEGFLEATQWGLHWHTQANHEHGFNSADGNISNSLSYNLRWQLILNNYSSFCTSFRFFQDTIYTVLYIEMEVISSIFPIFLYYFSNIALFYKPIIIFSLTFLFQNVKFDFTTFSKPYF